MTGLGVTITFATVTILVAQFLRRRRASYSWYGWLGIVALAIAEFLMFHGVQPVATYFTPLVWTTYILSADAAVFAIRGHSRLHDAPLAVARLALLSIPLWMIFEAYNLRLRNWIYTGVPHNWEAVVFGYGWSFATIWPAIFETADLIESLVPFRRSRAIKISRSMENILIGVGIACLLIPVLLPARIGAYLFVLVWLGFIFLLDPVNRRLGLPSFLKDLSDGLPARFFSFLAAGWVCGWLWEFWNDWAAAQWHYIFPIFQNLKIFEMPVPGYFGFLPFALECFVMYVFATHLVGWTAPEK